MLGKELIGKNYPVYNSDSSPVGSKLITNVIDVENCAGFVIQLDNSQDTGILISYVQAVRLNNKENQND